MENEKSQKKMSVGELIGYGISLIVFGAFFLNFEIKTEGPWFLIAMAIAMILAGIVSLVSSIIVYSDSKSKAQQKVSPLVQSLTSNNEVTFLGGLKEAVQLAESGSSEGTEAMKQAMKIRGGNNNLRFYSPGIIITGNSEERYSGVQQKILALGANKKLLEDPYHSGDLITAFIQFSDDKDIRSLLNEIYDAGGIEQGYSFQLLYNDLIFTARLSQKEI